MQDLIATAEAAAHAALDAAAQAIRPHFRTPLAADTKSDESPVTIADRNAEMAMRAVLEARFPDHGIIGEEFPNLRESARYRWVLDPVDGTRAFITGRPIFGTLIALLDGDTPILGLIDQPITNERWIGIHGQPTQFRGPYGKPGARPCPTLADAELSCTSPDLFTSAQRPAFDRLRQSARRVTYGGDCYAYALIALGLIDAIVEPGLKLWDWAALVPVIEGAGGLVRDWQGHPLTPASDGNVIAVGDPSLLPQIVALLRT